jgi:phage anti-repressor protein
VDSKNHTLNLSLHRQLDVTQQSSALTRRVKEKGGLSGKYWGEVERSERELSLFSFRIGVFIREAFRQRQLSVRSPVIK